MELRKELVAAITSAVHLYMQTEPQAVTYVEPARAPETPRPLFSPWVMSGRQSAMEMRRLWQMRLVS